MKRLTRYVNRPAFGVAAGIFIVLALVFAFLNIFHWLPARFGVESLLIRALLGILVLGIWVLLNIPPPKFKGFVIALAQLAEEREPDGALYGMLRKPRRSLLARRDYIDEEEHEEQEQALETSKWVKAYLRTRRSQSNSNLPSGPTYQALPAGQNDAATALAATRRPRMLDGGAADGSPSERPLARAANNLPAEDDEEERLAAPPKKFTPPPALWQEVDGPTMLTDYLTGRVHDKLKDAQISDITLFDADTVVTNRAQALWEGKYPNAGAIIWGWNVYGTRREFVPVVELPEPLEDKREQHGQLQILGLKSFDLGQQTARYPTTFSGFVSGLGAYALERYEKARSEFSLALVSAYMHSSVRKQDVGIDRTIIYFFLGNTQYYLRDYENAVNSYREALALDPHMYEARHNLGVCLILQGKVDFAIKRLIEVIQTKPNLAVARYNLGVAYLKKKQYIKAREQLNNAIRLNEGYAAAYRAIGLSYSEEQAEEEARSYFRDALRLDPKFAEVYVDLALLHYRKAEPDLKKIRELRKVEQSRDQLRIQQARTELNVLLRRSGEKLLVILDMAKPELEEALKINARLPEALYQLGKVLHDESLIVEQEGLKDQGLNYLSEAVQLRPNFADAHEELADIYEARYRYDLRDRHLKLMGEARSATAATNAKDLIKAGIAQRLNKQLPQARETLLKALKLEPRNSDAQFELGLIYQELDEPSQAMAMFQSVLNLPNPPDEVYEGIAKIYRQQGQEEEAFNFIQRAATEKPQSPLLAYYLGNAYRRQQNTARAIESYQKAIALDPELPDVRFNLGLLYLGKRQLQDAALQFEEVVRLRSDDFTTYRYLGRAYVDMKQIDQAIGALQKAVDIKADALDARLELGQIYLNRMEPDDAKEQFEAVLKYDPNNMRARELLGKAYAQAGQIDMAIETFQNMLLITPDSHAAHYNLGVAYASENRYDEAAREFYAVIQLKRDDADAYFNLGLAYDKLDKPHEAIAAFQRAIHYRPSFADAYRYMGQVYFRINDMNAGLKAVQQAEQLKRS